MNLKKLCLSAILSLTLWGFPTLEATSTEFVRVTPELLEEYVEPVAIEATEEVVIEYEEHLVYTTETVNAREYPTIDSAVIETVPQYTEILRTSEEINGWDCVIVNEQELFIKHEYLTNEPPVKSLGVCGLTAYCACSYCCGKSDGITASGARATQGRTVACNWLPFGTKVIINGETYIVEDTGDPDVLGNNFDIYFDSHEEAKTFGRQSAEVYIECGDLAN